MLILIPVFAVIALAVWAARYLWDRWWISSNPLKDVKDFTPLTLAMEEAEFVTKDTEGYEGTTKVTLKRS